MKKQLLLILLAFQFASLPAQATPWDFRFHFGGQSHSLDLPKLCSTCLSPAPQSALAYNWGLDVLYHLPFQYDPMLGLRVENLSSTLARSSRTTKIDNRRLALIANVNWLDNKNHYLGVLSGLGILHTLKITTNEMGATQSRFRESSPLSFNLALAGGFRFNNNSLGAEVGYQLYQNSDASDSLGNAPSQDINMNGFYYKLVLGFSL